MIANKKQKKSKKIEMQFFQHKNVGKPTFFLLLKDSKI